MKKRLAIVMIVMALLFCTGTITYAYSWVNNGSVSLIDTRTHGILKDLWDTIFGGNKTPCWPVTEHSQYKEDACVKCGTCIWVRYVKPNGIVSEC